MIFGLFEVEALLVLLPFFLTIAAKIISLKKGEDGKMSRAYKNQFPTNKRLYQLFCIVILATVAIMVWRDVGDFLASLPLQIRKPLEIIQIILVFVSGLLWILSEVIREDFPWGIFRVCERIVLLFLMGVGVSLVITGVGDLLGAHSKLFTAIFTVVLWCVSAAASLFSIPLTLKLVDEMWLLVRFPNKERREAYKKERARIEAEIAYKEWAKKQAYLNADTDWLSRDYTGIDEYGHEIKTRKTAQGSYVDEKGNEYKKKNPEWWEE